MAESKQGVDVSFLTATIERLSTLNDEIKASGAFLCGPEWIKSVYSAEEQKLSPQQKNMLDSIAANGELEAKQKEVFKNMIESQAQSYNPYVQNLTIASNTIKNLISSLAPISGMSRDSVNKLNQVSSISKSVVVAFKANVESLIQVSELFVGNKSDAFKPLFTMIMGFKQKYATYEARTARLKMLRAKQMTTEGLTEAEQKEYDEISGLAKQGEPVDPFDAMVTLNGCIGSLLGSLKSFEKVEVINPITLKWKLMFSVFNLNQVIKDISKIFKGIDIESLRQTAQDMAGSTTTDVIEETADSLKNTVTKNINVMGPIDLINATLGMIKGLEDIKISNPIKLKLAIVMGKMSVNMLIDFMKGMQNQLDKTMTKKQQERITQSITNLKSLLELFESIKMIEKELIKGAALTIPATAALLPASLFLLGLWDFVFILKFVVKSIASAIDANTHKGILELAAIVGLLNLVALGIVALGLIAIFVLPNIGKTLLLLGAMILIVGIVWIISKIVNSIGTDALLGMLIVVGILALVLVATGIVLLIGIMGAAIDWIGVLLAFGGILAVTLAATALGWLVIAAVEVIVPAIVAFTVLAVFFLVILATVGILWLIGQIKLDKDAIMSNIHAVFDIINDMVKLVFGEYETGEGNSDNKDRGIIDTIIRTFIKPLKPLIGMIMRIPILITTIICVGTILLICGMLWLIQQIDLDPDKIIENVGTTLKTIDMILDRINEKREPSTEDLSFSLLDVISWISPGMYNVVRALLSLVVVVTAILVVGAVLVLAGLLRALQEIDLDHEKISSNLTAVFDSLDLILFRCNNPSGLQKGEGGFSFMNIIRAFLPEAMVKVFEALASVLVIATASMAVGAVLALAKLLEQLQDISLDSGLIMGNVDKILDLVDSITDKIKHRHDVVSTPSSDSGGGWLSRGWNKIKRGASKVVNAVSNVVGGAVDIVSNMGGAGVLASALPILLNLQSAASVLQAINDINIDTNRVHQKTDSILNIVDTISSKVRFGKGTSSIDGGKVDKFEKFTQDNVKLYKGINDLDVEKVTSLTQMYKQMTEFMDTIKDLDIDGITDALVNKISPALKDINDSMGDINTGKQEQAKKQETKEKKQEQQQKQSSNDLKEITQQLQSITRALTRNGIVVQGLN